MIFYTVRFTLDLNSDFFESGGNSLPAVILLIEIEQLNGRSLSAAEIFFHSTPAAMAQYPESNKQEKMPMAGTFGMPAVFLIPPAGITNLAFIPMASLPGENKDACATYGKPIWKQ